MKQGLIWTAVLAALTGAAGGYWFAERSIHKAVLVQPERKIRFYRHPMNPSVTSPVPAKDEMGMSYTPVYEETPANEGGGAPAEKTERKVLYYRNPMGLADTSPAPKKDAMGMDYLPVYAENNGLLQISPEKIQKLGVRTAVVKQRLIERTLRNVGIVESDERRLHNVTLRFDGYIEKLFVNTTGQAVARGQPLFELYSPELISAQREYLIAKQAAAAGNAASTLSHPNELAESSLARLRNWGISEQDLDALKNQDQAHYRLTVRSPAGGIVMEKSVVVGNRVMAGEVLFKIADLSQVWVLAEVFEQDAGLIRTGQAVRARLDAFPGQVFQGKVAFIYPLVNPETRTVKVRVELPNAKGLLKPMMYAQLEIAAMSHRALAVPRSAILDSGRRSLVLVDRGEGRFEPRPVRLGAQDDDNVEVLDGLSEREQVVTSANFLIDAESNLKGALGGFEQAPDSAESARPSGER
jgi:membrane fusion protein, copper/silver efflux system